MPLYEYQCQRCKEVIESYVSLASQEPLQYCHCRPNTLMKRIPISRPGLVKVGGAEGKKRTADKIRKRNDDHFASKGGQEEYIESVRKSHAKYGIR